MLAKALERAVPFPGPAQPIFRFADFFAGVGGFRLALQDLGGQCVFSCEIDANAQRTYEANFGETPFDDVRRVEARDLPPHDVLAGGFPCQAFSIAGRRGGFEDTRGTLFFDLARLIRVRRPQAVFLENVKGLKNHAGGKTLETILHVLRRDLGYHVPEPRIINAKHFGVPQNRERIFIVGFADKADAERFFWPEPSSDVPTFAQVKERGPVCTKYYVSKRYWESLKAHRARHESKGNGFGYEIIADDGVANAIVVGGMGRERNLVRDPAPPDNPAYRDEINDENIRRMTPREWARLQGFPDDFIIPVADVHAYKQFGNSVAVPAVRAVARKILSALGYVEPLA